jgi:hypothetical protein
MIEALIANHIVEIVVVIMALCVVAIIATVGALVYIVARRGKNRNE